MRCGYFGRLRQIVSPPSDAHWPNVSALLHFDGNPIDQKGHVFDQAGTVGYSTGVFQQAMTLTAGDSGLIARTSSPDFAMGTGDFTLELFCLLASGFPGAALVSHFNSGASPNGWQVYIGSNGIAQWYQFAGGPSYPITGKTDLRDGKFHHLAITRSAGVLRMFVDGKLEGSASNSVDYGSSGLLLSIGFQAQGNARYPFRGFVDEFRLTKGVARYTSEFAPPVSPFPGQ